MKKETDNRTNWIIGVLALIIILFVAGTFGNNYGGMGMMGGFFGFGWLFMSLIFVALILFIVWLIKQIQKK